MANHNETLLIEGLRQQKASAYAELIDAYQHMVFTLCLKVLGNREEAEEVAQDAFIKAIASIDKFKGESKLSTWLYKIVYRKCLDRLKQLKRKPWSLGIDKATEKYFVADNEGGMTGFEKSEHSQLIKECINQLPTDEALLVTLFYYEESSLSEIAEVLGITENNAKVKLYRCRSKLASVIKENVEPAILESYGI